MAEIHDLVAAYALDALDSDEERHFEAHLETCPSCKSELSRMRESATDLADAVAMEPPQDLKARIMAATEPQAIPLTPRARRRPTRWLVAAAAAVVALLFVGVWAVFDAGDPDLVTAVRQARDATTVEIETPNGPAEFVYSPSLEAGVFDGEQLASLGSDELYQLWLIGDDVPDSAGTFQPGATEVLVERVEPGLVLAMTVESSPGADSPTSDPLFATEL